MRLLIGIPFLATLVNAGVGRAGLFSESLRLRDYLVGDWAAGVSRRQTLNVPAECKTICDPVTSNFNSCTPTSCCTSTFETAYFGCFLCVGGTSNTVNYTAPQQGLDDYVRACASNGIQVPRLTFPGQDPNRPPGNSSAIASPAIPSTGVNSAPGTSASLTVTTDLAPPPQQTTITSVPTTTMEPNTLPDPTDPAFAPPNNSGWRTTSGQWWVGTMVLTVGSLMGGFLIL